jgi:hypothetical protein
MRFMSRHTGRRFALAVALVVPSSACGAAGGSGSVAVTAATAHDAGPTAAVRAGEYRLSMSATCDDEEKTATGRLTLERIAGVDAAGDETAVGLPAEGALLWGQTNLDFGQLAGCLSHREATSGEPIHPSVLVEVLRWDGGRQHQVLLVSTDAKNDGAGVGVAMWVEQVDRGHISGVWSRWELIEQGEGR